MNISAEALTQARQSRPDYQQSIRPAAPSTMSELYGLKTQKNIINNLSTHDAASALSAARKGIVDASLFAVESAESDSRKGGCCVYDDNGELVGFAEYED